MLDPAQRQELESLRVMIETGRMPSDPVLQVSPTPEAPKDIPPLCVCICPYEDYGSLKDKEVKPLTPQKKEPEHPAPFQPLVLCETEQRAYELASSVLRLKAEAHAFQPGYLLPREDERRLDLCRISPEPTEEEVLKEYHQAETIQPPDSLDPIFVSVHHTEESRQNLARSLAIVPHEYRDGLQLFSVPPTTHDCQSYCGLGYANDMEEETPWRPGRGWVKLQDNTDFSCRKGFEKVFVYKHHYGRQWGDGTTLQKFGYTRYGATAVYRFTDPNHPYITDSYGPVQEVWVRPCPEGDVPEPYFRGQSTHYGAPQEDSELSRTTRDLENQAVTDWYEHYNTLRQQETEKRERLNATGYYRF